jgi:ribokinase
MTVLVIGNATVDISFEVERLPRPGETLLARSRTVDAGGKGLNQAIAARRAGAAVRYLAAIGDDPAGQVLRDRLAAEGLLADLLVRPGPSDESIICLAPGGDNCIVSTDAMAKSVSFEDATGHLAALASGDILLMQGNLSRATTAGCLEQARACRVKTLLNPAPIAFDYAGLWPLVDCAIVNQVEDRELTGETEPRAAAAALRAAGAGRVVVTLGADGALIVDAIGEATIPAEPVAAIDTTGAGDVFCGVLAAGLDLGLDALSAARWAVRAATLSVTRRGTTAAFPSADQLALLRRGDLHA